MRSDFYALPYAAQRAIRQGERDRRRARALASKLATQKTYEDGLREAAAVAWDHVSATEIGLPGRVQATTATKIANAILALIDQPEGGHDGQG